MLQEQRCNKKHRKKEEGRKKRSTKGKIEERPRNRQKGKMSKAGESQGNRRWTVRKEEHWTLEEGGEWSYG